MTPSNTTSPPDPANIPLVLLSTVAFAAEKHRLQKRKDKDGTPYINHPIGVALILSEEGGVSDIPTLQAAVLHDTVEDTATTFAELEDRFGKKVADIVSEVTDDKSKSKAERKAAQIVRAATCSREAKLVKLADKIYNLRDLERQTPVGWTEERVSEYFRWAEKVVEQCYNVSPELATVLRDIFRRRKEKESA